MSIDLGIRTTWVQISSPPIHSCVILEKLLHLFIPPFFLIIQCVKWYPLEGLSCM